MNPALDESEAGEIIDGRYRLERVIGRGGMGTVWLARHLQLDRPVAIKLMRASDARATKRFLHEARTAATVRHAHVVDILDFGLVREGEPYMVMELLEGMPLSERLRAAPSLTIAELLDIVDATLSGLAVIHQAGIVHRDLKQENVFLVDGRDGPVPKVVDFGLSAPAPGSETPLASGVLTLEGEILGTPSYMSPEQVRRLEDIDHRADVYSVGVLLYTALTGQLPYDAPNFMDVLLAIAGDVEAERVDVLRPEVGRALSDVVHRAMNKDRDARYPDVVSLRKALATVDDSSVRALDARPLTRRHRRPTPLGNDTAIGGLVLTAPEITVLRDPTSRTSAVPGPTSRWWMFGAALALAVVAIAVVSSTLAGRSGDATQANLSLASGSTAETAALSIAIVVGQLPDGARVSIDGRAVSGTRIRHVRDLRRHTIAVAADGFEPWSLSFVADSDQSIDPELTPIVELEPEHPTMRSAELPVEETVADAPPAATPEIFEELDY